MKSTSTNQPAPAKAEFTCINSAAAKETEHRVHVTQGTTIFQKQIGPVNLTVKTTSPRTATVR